MNITINFDMDGTIADLYANPNWLPMLRAFDPTPYATAKPLLRLNTLARKLNELQKQGYEIAVISWLSKESNPTFDRKVCQAKIDWLRSYDFPFDEFHGIAYGVPKELSINSALRAGETALLIDDSAEVRNEWHAGEAIDPTTCDIIEVLRNLL